jgi:hypothetical protein
MNALLGSVPAATAGCPTSRSFFARCGIPQAYPSSLLRSPQLRTGAPCSHQRTWAENVGRSPSTAFRSGPQRPSPLSSRPKRSEVERSAVQPLSWKCFRLRHLLLRSISNSTPWERTVPLLLLTSVHFRTKNLVGGQPPKLVRALIICFPRFASGRRHALTDTHDE